MRPDGAAQREIPDDARWPWLPKLWRHERKGGRSS